MTEYLSITVMEASRDTYQIGKSDGDEALMERARREYISARASAERDLIPGREGFPIDIEEAII